MPLQAPNLDDRRYQQLLDDFMRVPIHTPEWTNFNQSDPGVTIVQLFAFLTETLIYRANQILTAIDRFCNFSGSRCSPLPRHRASLRLPTLVAHCRLSR